MQCRPRCGACCIAPSISSALPDLPEGKPSNLPCPHLDKLFRCQLFGRPERPRVCQQLQAHPEMCGKNRQQALHYLLILEEQTSP